MPLNLFLVGQRQSPQGMALFWGTSQGVAAYQVFVARRRMTPEELEAAHLLGGTEDCTVAKVGAEVSSVVDDITPQGETRHYGVAMVLEDGSLKAARFRTAPDGGQGESFHLSMVRAHMTTGSYRVKAEPPLPPAAFPLREPIDIRIQGATQTWDGLRIYWEREPRAAAYEIIASDHQIAGDELTDALAGKVDFTTATAVGPNVNCVIDNTTPREARGWYSVLVRHRDGRRVPHPFQIGDAAASGKLSAPFLNPNRTGELRAEVEGLLADAREQWEHWRREQDAGARREARRMAGDALLIWPEYPAAKQLLAEMS
jgi:hypothetical protein